ncbi:hypothetical protein LOC71_20245 [Rhodopirellula sp. JC740]|uniref:Prepilin-type N-terminal cleavage/methylation domain-containing protein n=1 Tax=Rhodopirellula halodulae TaxID=2894198 RepID=A0ABS8NM01_9BACT|nr:hypothetical protein [Rhodopirellula sp. JC740]
MTKAASLNRLNVSHRHRGVSLIETIACVAIVATLATSMVGMMRGSARVSAISQGHEGAPAEARQALRFVGQKIRDLTSGGQSVVSVRNRDFQLDDGLSVRRVRFEIRRSSDGVNRSLVMVDPLFGETVCLDGAIRTFNMNELIVAGQRVGIEMTVQMQASADRAAELRPDQRNAEVTTVVCLSPQL